MSGNTPALVNFDQLNFSGKVKNILTMDSIRAQKLLEIGQFTAIAMALGFVLSYAIEKLFPAYDATKSAKRIALELLGQALVIGFVTYYIRKIIRLVPFLFKFTDNYVSSLKGESTFGLTIGLGIVMVANMANFRAKIDRLRALTFNASL
jgi:hypothetical protein